MASVLIQEVNSAMKHGTPNVETEKDRYGDKIITSKVNNTLKKKHYGSYDFANKDTNEYYCNDLVVNNQPDIPLKVPLSKSGLSISDKI